MKSRGIIDFYLPNKVAYHVKILLGGLFSAMFFNVIWTGTPINDNFWVIFPLVVVQLEIFMAIALKIFNDHTIKSGDSYKKQIIRKLVKFFLIVLLIATIILFITILIGMPFSDQTFSDIMSHFVRNELKGLLISWLIGISIGSLIFFYMEWNHALKREQRLREEKLIFQYETLKNQVNPHFLFNSLNTLSSLVSRDAQLSEKFIHKLSTIYRYILENRDVEFISLSKEIEFVKSYFFLQKIRDNGKIDLNLQLSDENKYEILPISIQLLVENALKHNVATLENPLRISISTNTDHVIVENNLQPKMQMGDSSKLGLINLKERVKLVMNREVNVESSENSFVVKMPIKSK